MIVKPHAVPFVCVYEAAILAHLTGHDWAVECSFDHIRSSIGATVEQLPDGHIHQVCIDAGHEVTF